MRRASRPSRSRPRARLRGVLVCVGIVVLAAVGPQPRRSAPVSRSAVVEAAHTGEPVPFDISEWKTNFKKHSVPLREIISGGPPKDGIPAIDRPRFETVVAATRWLRPPEPVVLLDRGRDPRAYPLQILIWHEIANDVIAGVPAAVTFCPLCNTAIAFDRRLAGRVLDFGTTGRLRFSDLVMYDRQTESWWQQITGEAIVGDLTGKRLAFLPSQVVSWETFRRTFPGGKVLSRNTGHARAYGRNPYAGYDHVGSSPFLYNGPNDGRLRPLERVVTVSHGGEDAAYPFSALERVAVVHDTVGGRPIVVFFLKGTASALDASDIVRGRDIGAAAVFVPAAGGRALRFEAASAGFVDRQSRSTWDIVGRATAGPLKGARLEPVIHGNHFWFAWAVFRPRTRVYRP